MKTNKIAYEGSPCRLDVFVTGTGENFSRPFARSLVLEGLVTVNGEMKKPSYQLNTGDTVEIRAPETGGLHGGFEKLVLFEDKDLLAIEKPAGLPVHPNSANWEVNPQAALLVEPTVISMLFTARPGMAKTGVSRLGLVHRLDRDTSGLMVLAKTPEAQDALSAGFRDRLIEKTYLGGVAGIPEDRAGIIDAPIGRATGFKKIKVWEFGRDAVTEYKVKEKGPDCALLEIHPRTGRTNQIRIHMEYLGHSIIGDKLYGGRPAERMLLHSTRLVFKHPVTGKKMDLESPMPEDFKKVWKAAKAKKTTKSR
ncbi:MAG TPA: RluA family pseudouridine synthase [Elusimicrobiales bacterium]|nr:RluA family pseudouridine synthase [Elusimicrobiales bacterium]